MKVAILGAGSALGARIIESFCLGEGPSMAAIAAESSQLAAAARFPIDLRIVDPFGFESLARSFAGCSAAVHTLPVEVADLERSVLAFCRAAAEAGLRRIVYISTLDVYGVNPPAGTTEKSRLHLNHASQEVNARVAADRLFTSECRRLDLAGVLIRPGLVYGPRSAWLIETVQTLSQRQNWAAIPGRGICNCVYVDHVVALIRLIFKTKGPVVNTLLLTDDETVTWREFYENVAQEFELMAPSPFLRLESEDSEAGGGIDRRLRPAGFSAETLTRHDCAWKFSTTSAARILGLQPVASLTERLRRSAAWWRFARGNFANA